MGKEKFVLVFEIGSSHIRAMLAGRGINNTFVVKGFKDVEYDGFYEGNFLAQEKLPELFGEILNALDIRVKNGLDKVYIGVPAEFSSVRTADVSLNFGQRRKVKKKDVDSLFYMASEKAKNSDVEVVSVSPINFTLDDERKTLKPVGEFASSISANLSIVYADREFISLFNDIVAGYDFSSVEYISEPLSQARFLLPKEKQEDLSLLIDCGDLTTSIAFAKGEGLIGLTSFARGGGFITNDLAEAFDLSMGEADRLKKQLVLSLKGGAKDFYELSLDGGKVEKIPLNEAGEVAGYRIDEIAQVIAKCIQMFVKENNIALPVFLSGAGISKIKGGRDYLAKCIGRNISFAQPSLPGKEKPWQASIYSLVDTALGLAEQKE